MINCNKNQEEIYPSQKIMKTKGHQKLA